MSTNYKAMTPCGAFEATWGDDEESRVEYSGSADAIEYFRAFLDFNSVTGRGGAIIRFDTLEPADLYGFCQSQEHGITVLPNEDDLIDEKQGDEMEMTLMDAVGPAEAFELIGEGAQIFGRLDENADTFFGDLDRLREIMLELSDDTPAPEGEAALQAALERYQAAYGDNFKFVHDSILGELGFIAADVRSFNEWGANFSQALKSGDEQAQLKMLAEDFLPILEKNGYPQPHSQAMADATQELRAKLRGSEAPAAADPDSAYLQTVIDGTADLSHWSVPADLGKIYEARAGDAGILALFKAAVTAYANYAIAQASEALKG